MDPVNQTDFEATEIPGQAVLPGFQDLLQCEAQALAKPEHELFCVRFVEFGGDTAKAWQAAIDKDCSRRQAQKNAQKLLKNGDIRSRIQQISAVMRNRTIADVISYQRRAMEFDPAELFDPVTGKQRKVHEIPEHLRKGIGLEARVHDGAIVYLPVFPAPQRAAESLAKMMGVEKQIIELSGKDGGPIVTKIERVIVTP
jgi:acetamidase/formamidase